MNKTKQQWTVTTFVVLAEGDFASVRRECDTEAEARALVTSLRRFGFECAIVAKATRTLD